MSDLFAWMQGAADAQAEYGGILHETILNVEGDGLWAKDFEMLTELQNEALDA